jgi:biopolymer transport protein ExbD
MFGSDAFYERKKSRSAGSLSLVSLMDIFTILVFFLLLNSGDSREIENARFVALPDSVSGAAPHTDLHLTVTGDGILLGDELVVTRGELDAADGRVIEPLAAALEALTERRGALTDYERRMGLPVTILGDREVPYARLQQVMTTCQAANYRNISLAVNRVNGVALTTPSPATGDELALNVSSLGEGH